MRLFDFIERLVTWEATTDEAIMEQARKLIRIATNGKPPPLLDPFAGGGSIPLEAQRLCLEAHASDLNPVAVMINKAMIEIPPRFAGMPPVNPRDRKGLFTSEAQRAESERGDSTPVESGRGDSPSRPRWKGAAGLAADVRYYGEWMRERAFVRIGHLYPKHNDETVIAWLWARTVISPNPAVNAPVPLARSFVLSKKKGRECWAKPVIEGTTARFKVTEGKPPKGEDGTMIRRQGAKCIISGEPMTFDYIKQEGKAGRFGAMLLAIVTEGKRGRNYYSPSAEHVQIAESAEPAWRPVGEMEEGNQNVRGRMWGLRDFADLFTPRQLTALTTFSDLVHEAREQVYADALKAGLADDDKPLREGGRGARAYGEAVSVYLAFAVDKATDNLSANCTWIQSGENMRTVFARQAIPMVWDYAEANPFSYSVGSWKNCFMRLSEAIASISANSLGFAFQADAQSLSPKMKMPTPPPPRKSTFPQYSPPSRLVLSTDPPYYDNIGYADLSDFFYIWLRQVYPDIFDTMLVPKADELIASRHRHGSKAEAKDFFESGMAQAFAHFRSFVSHDYPQTVYYAFKQQDAGFMNAFSQRDGTTEGGGKIASSGWETMLKSLIEAGFSIVGTWPMRTERKGRINAIAANALASSIVLVCRPRPDDAPATSRRRFLDALRAELPRAIAEMKTGSIAPVDLAQASIGPGMAIYSRYSAVLEADGAPLTVRTALGLINAVLDEALEEPVANLEAETRFAVGWFEEVGFKEGEFGRADVLARGMNTAVESAVQAGLVEAKAGKVRLIHWKEYDPCAYEPAQDKRPTVWEGAHHLIERLNSHGETGAAALYNKLPGDMAESARDLAYRLYLICDRKKWAGDALDYNTLVSSWSEITRLASSAEASGTTQAMFDD